MRIIFLRVLFPLAISLHMQGCDDGSDTRNIKDQIVAEAEAEATAVLERHMIARNNSDAEGLADENNYPLKRLSRGQVQTFDTWEEYKNAEEAIDIVLKQSGWHHSTWNEIQIIQSSENKVHFAIEYSRYNEANEPYLTTETFYIVNLQDNHWGNILRSSFDGDANVGGDNSEAEQAAIDVLDRRIEERNNRNSEALAELNNYEFVYLQDNELQVFDTINDYIVYEETVVIPELDYSGWNHSEWTALDVVQSSENKVHIAAKLGLFSVTGENYDSQDQLYVVVNIDGEWKIQALSNFVEAIQREE